MSDGRIPKHVDRIVGERMANARQENGLSQADLAARLGISSQEVLKYETGEERMSAGLLCEVSFILSKTVDFFFFSEPQTSTWLMLMKPMSKLDIV